MTTTRGTAPENPQPATPAAPQEPGDPRTRLAPGTRVTMEIAGVLRTGVVQLYEPHNTRNSASFPVRFDHNQQWRMLLADEVTVVSPPKGTEQ